MTLTLTPQELRDLLDGASPSITTRIVAPVNPPDDEYNGLRPPGLPKTSPYVKPFYPENPTLTTSGPTACTTMVRHEPPVDMTSHATCAPRAGLT